MKAVIIVTPKPSVFDPQGEAVCRAVHSLGLKGVTGVRIGKYIEVDIKGGASDALRKKLETVSHELLSNPVIEDYKLELGDKPRPAASRRAPKKAAPRAKTSAPSSPAPAAPAKPAAAPVADWRPGDGKKKKDKLKKKDKAEKKDGKKKSKKKGKL